MRLIDLRDENLPSPLATAGGPDEGRSDEERSYLVLASDATYRFRLDLGNKIPWDHLQGMLEKRLPGNGHEALHDVSVGSSDALIDARVGTEGIRWICAELLARDVLPPSAPVSVQHTDGEDERLGALGKLAQAPRLSEAAYA